MDLKINEKAAIAQKQFMDKASRLIDNVKLSKALALIKGTKYIQDVREKAN